MLLFAAGGARFTYLMLAAGSLGIVGSVIWAADLCIIPDPTSRCPQRNNSVTETHSTRLWRESAIRRDCLDTGTEPVSDTART